MSEDVTEATAQDGQARALAREISDALHEPNIALIYRVITVIGPERAQAFLRETLELEAKDGLLRKDGKRRTPGGAFFYHVCGKLPVAERKRLWPIRRKQPAVRTVDPSAVPLAGKAVPAPAKPQPGACYLKRLQHLRRLGENTSKPSPDPQG